MRKSDQRHVCEEIRRETSARAVEIEGGLLLISLPKPSVREGGTRTALLTRTEREVAELVIQGLSNAEIAAQRGCSLRTVANHVAAVFTKLGISSRRALRASLLGKGPSL
jgi:DNA-binding CsgD family transcriptional regulator